MTTTNASPVLAMIQRGQLPGLKLLAAFLLPLFFSSLLNVVLDVTDTWFIAQIAPEATAGQGGVYYAMVVLFLFSGGACMGVQTLVAQAMGARMRGRAVRLLWGALIYAAATGVLFAAWWELAPVGVTQLGLTPLLHDYALAYLQSRLLGGPLVIGFWALLGFFNGTGRTGQSLQLMAMVALVNGLFNWLFTSYTSLGVAGTAWATNTALALGLVVGIGRLMCAPSLRNFRAARLFRLNRLPLRSLLAMGLPIGGWAAAEVTSWAIFQATQSRFGMVDGAATHIVIMLTSLVYWPALGLGMGNSTLVGQALGAGYPQLAWKLGNRLLLMMLGYAGAMGLCVAIAGPWLLPYFIATNAHGGGDIVTLGIQLLWIAATYQLFDVLNIGSGFALRGAGDVIRPSLYLIVLAWGFFLPLLQAFTFAPGEGFIPALGWLGMGALGGWMAAWIYIALLGVIVWRRWANRHWMRPWLTKAAA